MDEIAVSDMTSKCYLQELADKDLRLCMVSLKTLNQLLLTNMIENKPPNGRKVKK